MLKRVIGSGLLVGGSCVGYYTFLSHDQKSKLNEYRNQYLEKNKYGALNERWQYNRSLAQAAQLSFNKITTETNSVLAAMSPLQQRLMELENEKAKLEAVTNSSKLENKKILKEVEEVIKMEKLWINEMKNKVKKEIEQKVNQLNNEEYKAYLQKCSLNKENVESQSESQFAELVKNTIQSDKLLKSMFE